MRDVTTFKIFLTSLVLRRSQHAPVAVGVPIVVAQVQEGAAEEAAEEP
jgi:hypothetical protein